MQYFSPNNEGICFRDRKTDYCLKCVCPQKVRLFSTAVSDECAIECLRLHHCLSELMSHINKVK